MVTSIGNINSDATPASPERIPVQKLGQQDFIKLLVAQLTTQDPMNPQKDTEFIGQMAQFSALESSKALNEEITSMRQHQQFLQANSTIGRTVEVLGEDGEKVTGPVSSVEMVANEPQLVVNGQQYSLKNLVRVWQDAPAEFKPVTQAPAEPAPIKAAG